VRGGNGLATKVGGPEIEQALRMDSINGYEMDKKWFLN